MSRLEVYERDGQPVRTIAMTPDADDASEWHLAVPFSLGVHESAQIVIDGHPPVPRLASSQGPSRSTRCSTHVPSLHEGK